MPTTLLQVPRRTSGCLRVLPQVSRHLLWRLRVLPQVSRRLPWRLRESRKCFGELVGRYNMLSMTFSMNKGISFFRRTHVCLPSAEAFCCRPNYAAYSGHCAKPIEYLFGPRRPPPRPGKYAWYMMRWNYTSYPAKLRWRPRPPRSLRKEPALSSRPRFLTRKHEKTTHP